MESKRPPDFIATLTFFKTEEGGRKGPAYSEYRPQIKFPFSEMHTSGKQVYIGKEIVYPGETVDAEITMLSPNFFFGTLTDETEFEFKEGAKALGTGRIKNILNEKLRKIS